MGYDDILYDVENGIATLTFNRPAQRNSMGGRLIEETLDALERAGRERAVRVVIVTGAGDRAFCSGGDLGQLGDGSGASAGPAPTPYDRRAGLQRLQRLIFALRSLEKPVLAAVNGAAVGGGCDVALACDLRIASEHARFGEVFARIGLFPGTGGTYLLPRVVGVAKALELIWTGDLVDAQEAERIGLVSRVVPPAELLSATRALAARLAEGPPLALALAKAAVYRGLDLDLTAALDYAATAESITLSSDDHREGVRAFREKRKPSFRGR